LNLIATVSPIIPYWQLRAVSDIYAEEDSPLFDHLVDDGTEAIVLSASRVAKFHDQH